MSDATNPTAPASDIDKLRAMLAGKTSSSAAPGGGAPTATQEPAAQREEQPSEGFYVKASDIDRDWDLGKHLIRIEESEDYIGQKSGNPSFKLRYVGIAGTMKGAGIDDYLPKEGKGLKKTHRICKCVDLVDAEQNISIPGGAPQFIGREMWVEIVPKNETFYDENGDEQKRLKHVLDFLGYWPKDAFEMPQEGDLFAEPGQPLPKG